VLVSGPISLLTFAPTPQGRGGGGTVTVSRRTANKTLTNALTTAKLSAYQNNCRPTCRAKNWGTQQKRSPLTIFLIRNPTPLTFNAWSADRGPW